MRWAGDTVGFVFLPVALRLGVPPLTEAECVGSWIGEMIGGGVMAIGKEEGGEVE
jgi:hypothetical protein